MRTVKSEYIVEYYKNGNIILSESYLLNGKLHRENRYAYRSWYKNGNKRVEGYRLNDTPHREDGPAWIEWDRNGNIRTEYYYINGKRLTKEEFDFRNNSCNISVSGKVVEIDGRKYKLKEVQ